MRSSLCLRARAYDRDGRRVGRVQSDLGERVGLHRWSSGVAESRERRSKSFGARLLRRRRLGGDANELIKPVSLAISLPLSHPPTHSLTLSPSLVHIFCTSSHSLSLLVVPALTLSRSYTYSKIFACNLKPSARRRTNKPSGPMTTHRRRHHCHRGPVHRPRPTII